MAWADTNVLLFAVEVEIITDKLRAWKKKIPEETPQVLNT